MSASSSKEYSDGEDTCKKESTLEEESEEESIPEEESEETSDDEELEEPVLKYKHFSKEAVNSINGTSEEKNIICCVCVHSKVSSLQESLGKFAVHYLETDRLNYFYTCDQSDLELFLFILLTYYLFFWCHFMLAS